MFNLKAKELRARAVEWLQAGLLATPSVCLFIAWKKFGGWFWAALFMASVVAMIGIGYWSLCKAWEEDD